MRLDFPLPPDLEVPLFRDWRLCMWREVKAVSCQESSMVLDVLLIKIEVEVLVFRQGFLGPTD